jgi:GDP-4-dehydro-6-deoxy-D-mannose reductase
MTSPIVPAPILITGARGFVGSHLRAQLGDAAVSFEGDVRNAELVAAAVLATRPEAVVHLAGLASVAESWRGGGEVWHVNVVGTVNVLDAVGAGSPDARVLVVSTGDVYGRASVVPSPEEAEIAPLSPYAASKVAAEVACSRAARVDGLDIIVARAFPHIGPGQDQGFAVGSWTRQIVRLEAEGAGTLRVGDLSVERDLTDVRDVCRAYRLLLDRGVTPGTYNVASGTAVTMARVLDILVAMARVPITFEQDPALVRRVDLPVLCGDATRLRRATGWTPEIPLEATLADALEHARCGAAGEGAGKP